MPRSRSAAAILREVPPHVRAGLRRIGVDLDDPAQAKLFVDGVRAADECIAAESADEESASEGRRRRGRRSRTAPP